MYSTFLSKIRTKEDIQKLINEIEVILQSLYQKQGVESVLKAQVRAWVSQALEEDWKSAPNKEEYLIRLKEVLNGLKPLSLTISFEPTELSLEKLSYFVKQNLGGNIYLDINYDPRLLAGAIIVYQGRYLDMSLKKAYEAEFERSKVEIIKLLEKTHERL